MKFVLAAILMLVLGDLALTRGENTSMATHAIMRFFHAAGSETRDSVFTH